ncbi:MAG: galactonate dehydratase, partial [Rhodobacter sp.]|nr:galactonate dehydratase [Rhodobacter sp.]
MADVTIRLHATDNLVIALTDLGKGAAVPGVSVALPGPVPRGHKLATRAIARGEIVLRYGQSIGQATEDIPAGGHIHSHNLGMGPHSLDYAIGQSATPLPPLPAREFLGYHRADGQVGTRNYIGILTSVNCSGSVARFIAEAAEKDPGLSAMPNIDGFVPIVHNTGCGMSGVNEGYDTLMRTLKGYARNANFGGILLV